MSNFEKVKMQSPNITAENIKKIGEMFPEVLTEAWDEYGYIKKVINFDKLKQILSDHIVDGKENYEFTWVGKRNAIMEAGRPTTKTLRPKVEDSVNWNKTENVYIEGDNLEALKILQESYLGKIKMIYIDPPYNTGNDFIYNDNFRESVESHDEKLGAIDELGNRLIENKNTDSRYHSNWLNMIYSRLKLAKNLLKKDGLIFISIDDNEVQNLRKLCDEIFGEENFISCNIWQKIHSNKNDAKYFSENHEYILVYAKSKVDVKIGLLPRTKEMNERYKNPDNDPRGPWQSGDLVASGERSTGYFIVKSPITGKEFNVPEGKHWVYSEENLKKLVADNSIWFGKDGNAFPRKKRFLSEVQNGRTPGTLWLSNEVGHNQSATREVIKLFEGNRYFDFPKPVELIKRILQISTSDNDIILDFFSGSATTAHATMQMNLEDGGNRKFIAIQLKENTNEKTEAFKAGYKNISEIGKERIRRAGKKIIQENPNVAGKLDIGFKVFFIDETNMNPIYYTPSEVGQQQLFSMIENIKEDRTSLDLLYQVMLSLGMELSLKVDRQDLVGCEILDVDNGSLIACFANMVNDQIIRAIAAKEPLRAVFKESSFNNSSAKINLKEIFKELSPHTKVKVI